MLFKKKCYANIQRRESKMIDPYVYEDTGTLKNKLGIKDYDELRQA